MGAARWRRRASILVALAACATLAPRPASAQQAPYDVVTTRSGGRLQGRLITHEPGVRTVIQLGDGSTRVLPAAEVREVVRGGSAASPTPPTEDATEGTTLHVDAPAPVQVGQYLNTGAIGVDAFREVCVAPCDRPVPRRGLLAVRSPDMPDAMFRLSPEVHSITVTPGHNNTRGALNFLGAVVTILGGVVDLVGLVGLPATIAVSDKPEPILAFGGILLGGAAITTLGALMLVSNNHVATHVDDASGRRIVRHPTVRFTGLSVQF